MYSKLVRARLAASFVVTMWEKKVGTRTHLWVLFVALCIKGSWWSDVSHGGQLRRVGDSGKTSPLFPDCSMIRLELGPRGGGKEGITRNKSASPDPSLGCMKLFAHLSVIIKGKKVCG